MVGRVSDGRHWVQVWSATIRERTARFDQPTRSAPERQPKTGNCHRAVTLPSAEAAVRQAVIGPRQMPTNASWAAVMPEPRRARAGRAAPPVAVLAVASG